MKNEIEQNEIEQWKEIKEFQGRYKISNFGNVKSEFMKKCMKLICEYKYDVAKFKTDNNKIKKMRIHTLVAKYFVKNDDPANQTNIVHIDGNLKNNKWNNLRWDKLLDNENIEWKNIIGYDNRYMISHNGDIKNKIKNILLSKRIRRNYYVTTLRENGKRKNVLVHRLVAKHFIQNNVSHHNIVDHIDNNKLNNHYMNLRWTNNKGNIDSYNQNYKPMRNIIQYDLNGNIIKEWDGIQKILDNNKNYSYSTLMKCLGGHLKKGYGYLWKYKNGKKDSCIIFHIDEIFKNIGRFENYDFSNYEISNYGKIKSSLSNKILANHDRTYDEIKLVDKISLKYVAVSAHRLVAHIYVKGRTTMRQFVNHKDKNKLNNHYKNLEWVTIRENNIHARGKAIYQIDIETNQIIGAFECIMDAAKFLGIKYSSDISRCCKGNQKTAYGYIWKYIINSSLDDMENTLAYINKLMSRQITKSIKLLNTYRKLSAFRFNSVH